MNWSDPSSELPSPKSPASPSSPRYFAWSFPPPFALLKTEEEQRTHRAALQSLQSPSSLKKLSSISCQVIDEHFTHTEGVAGFIVQVDAETEVVYQEKHKKNASPYLIQAQNLLQSPDPLCENSVTLPTKSIKVTALWHKTLGKGQAPLITEPSLSLLKQRSLQLQIPLLSLPEKESPTLLPCPLAQYTSQGSLSTLTLQRAHARYCFTPLTFTAVSNGETRDATDEEKEALEALVEHYTPFHPSSQETSPSVSCPFIVPLYSHTPIPYTLEKGERPLPEESSFDHLLLEMLDAEIGSFTARQLREEEAGYE